MSEETTQTTNEELTQFEFDGEFEQKLLAFFVRDLKFFKSIPEMKPNYFVSEAREDIYRLFSEYVEKYGELPSQVDLKEKITGMYISKKKKDVVIDKYEELLADLYSRELKGEAYTRDKVMDFIKRQEMATALKDGAQRIMKGQDLNPILPNVEKVLDIGSKNAWDILTVEQVMAMNDPSPIFEGFNFYEECLYLLTGSGGDFKSLIGLAFIQSILKQLPLFGKFKPLVTGPVILIDEETPKPILKHRLINTGLKKFIECGYLHILHLKGFKIYDPDSDAWFNTLVRNADRIKPKLMLFDSLTRLHNEDEIKASRGMAPVMDRFRELSRRGYTSLVNHHFNKADVKSARGSTDIPNAVDGEYQCIRTGLNTLTFQPGGKTRNEMFEPLNLLVHGLLGLMVNEPIYVNCVGTVDEGIEDAIIKVLEHTKGIGLQVNSKSKSDPVTLQTQLKSRGVTPSLQKLREVVASLVDKEILEQYEGAKPIRGYAPTLYRLKTV